MDISSLASLDALVGPRIGVLNTGMDRGLFVEWCDLITKERHFEVVVSEQTGSKYVLDAPVQKRNFSLYFQRENIYEYRTYENLMFSERMCGVIGLFDRRAHADMDAVITSWGKLRKPRTE